MKRPARRFHKRFWLVFSLLIPIGFFVILSLKQQPADDGTPILLEEPR